MIIRGNVYDLSSYLDTHPGGPRIILKYAGRDATEEFEPIHPTNVIEKYLSPEYAIRVESLPTTRLTCI